MNDTIFVLGATGVQGAKISNELIKNGNRVITLSSESSKSFNQKTNVEIINGSLKDKNALRKALKGVTKAVYTFPLIFDMGMAVSYTNNFIEAAKEEKIKLIIFNTSFHLPNRDTGFLALDIKRKISNLFSESDLNVITLMPDIYMDNLIAPWMKPLIMNDGIIPYPIEEDQKVPWISQSDLGKAVCTVLETPGLIGRIIPIGGNIYTGKEIAQEISCNIQRKVNFIGLTPDEFEDNLVEGFGSLAAREISNLYRYVKENKLELYNKDFKKTNQLLGLKPESIKNFITTIDW